MKLTRTAQTVTLGNFEPKFPQLIACHIQAKSIACSIALLLVSLVAMGCSDESNVAQTTQSTENGSPNTSQNDESTDQMVVSSDHSDSTSAEDDQLSDDDSARTNESSDGNDEVSDDQTESESVERTASTNQSPENAELVRAEVQDDENPFPRQIEFPFEFPRDAEWLNTDGAIRMRDLRGKFVIFDFWTYCCINCIHVLPVLNRLEHKYPNELVVIGVHSAKFDTEMDADNIREAILRYKIEHPVINDPDHAIWDSFGVRSWPTLLMIDPEGKAVWMKPGESEFEEIDALLSEAIPYYDRKGVLDDSPIQFELHAFSQPNTPLSFPGKVLADESSDRLFISDSNHNRIVITTLAGELVDIVGNGQVGREDGGFDSASFNQPQGMCLVGSDLYVADTENHLIRVVHLEDETVETIAGLGFQGRVAFPGMDSIGPFDDLPERWVGAPMETALNSPWALFYHDAMLYIAMAGPHQIWFLDEEANEVGPYAGNGREDIVDGPLVPKQPYETGYSSFAQPSGLTSDGTWLFVADSEGSSIRAVPFNPDDEVRTVVGTNELPYNRLFEFGDVDGPREDVLLQHPLGVVYQNGFIYITDTYNNKVKKVNAETGETVTIAGTGEAGSSDSPATFDEPAGISLAGSTLYIADTNNHLIRTVDIESGEVGTLEIDELRSPPMLERPARRTADERDRGLVSGESLQPKDGHANLNVKIALPEGWKLNDIAPMSYTVLDETFEGIVDPSALADDATRLAEPTTEFTIQLPLSQDLGSDEVIIGVTFYYCQDGGEGLCKVAGVEWVVPIEVDPSSDNESIDLSYELTESEFGNE